MKPIKNRLKITVIFKYDIFTFKYDISNMIGHMIISMAVKQLITFIIKVCIIYVLYFVSYMSVYCAY